MCNEKHCFGFVNPHLVHDLVEVFEANQSIQFKPVYSVSLLIITFKY